MKLRKYKLIISLCVLILTSLAEGYAKDLVNTANDEVLPIIYNNNIYFSQIKRDKKKWNQNVIERTLYAPIDEYGVFKAPKQDKVIPTNQIANAGSPSFFFNKAEKRLEMYFAGSSKKNPLDKDIYYSYYAKNAWTPAVPIPGSVNTDAYESHPFISPDGTYLLFTSDREGSLGETDIYVAYRGKDGTWSDGQNLGNRINTPMREVAPFIASNGMLFYSSDGFSENTGLDVIKAEAANGGWKVLGAMPQPVNSDYDDLGAALHKNKLYISSDRPGGAGGFDIYAFEMCKNAIVKGRINGALSTDKPGILILSDEFNNVLEQRSIALGEEYSFELPANQGYRIVYKNDCNPKDMVYEFFVHCSETEQTVLTGDFENVVDTKIFSLEDVNIPFFVSGYYKPNTCENLDNLKLKFLHNFFGNADTTRYIQNPNNEYNEYCDQVEIAIDNAAGAIIDRIEAMNGECINPNAKILINIAGYADPRPISTFAKYADEDINEERLGLIVKRGSPMTNLLLSQLRAYHTFKLLENKLNTFEQYVQNHAKIKWRILGEGEDMSQKSENIEKRRVSVNISLE